ncbi:Probable protein arginine N-methyltransferase 6 [Ancistrocladus abbreviatus]
MLPSDSGHSNGHPQYGGAVVGGTTALSFRDRLRKVRRSRAGGEGRAGDGHGDGQPRVDGEERDRIPCTDFDIAYFQSYSHLGIHEEMIKDRVRTDTYRNAIFQYQDSIAGKVVVDVGCGTGILSIFCAQAGAKRVYAVDASDIAVQANEVVKANNLSDTVIVLHGRVEDVEIDEEVDVIISEWMGYMLLYESMLGSVITARDRWLKPGGLILPSNATVKHVDCYTVTMNELGSVMTKFNFKSMMRAPLHGFAFWFDVEFRGPANANNDAPSSHCEVSDNGSVKDNQRKKRANPNDALVLSTAPEDPPTHWQQTLLYFYEPIEVEQDQLVEGSVTLSQSKENPRFMNIHLDSGGRSFVKESVMR